jgi:hypothetical protein
MKPFDSKIEHFDGRNWHQRHFFSLPSKSGDRSLSSLKLGTKKITKTFEPKLNWKNIEGPIIYCF